MDVIKRYTKIRELPNCIFLLNLLVVVLEYRIFAISYSQ